MITNLLARREHILKEAAVNMVNQSRMEEKEMLSLSRFYYFPNRITRAPRGRLSMASTNSTIIILAQALPISKLSNCNYRSAKNERTGSIKIHWQMC